VSTSGDPQEIYTRPRTPELKGNPPALIVVAPILPGKAEAWRRFVQELAGSRQTAYEASRRRLGIRAERFWISETRQCVIGILLIEAEHPERLLAALGASSEAFDGWFRERLLTLQGLDLTRAQRAFLPELVFAWHGGQDQGGPQP
jgi:hypothetical protein